MMCKMFTQISRRKTKTKASLAFILPAALIIFALPAISKAQGLPQAPDLSLGLGLTVGGHAEINAKPDVAYAILGVMVQAKTQSSAVSEAAAKSEAVKQALIKAGITAKDIQTFSYQLEPRTDSTASPGGVIGYQVTNLFKVTIHNFAKAGTFVDRATAAGANVVNGISFDITDRSKLQSQVLAMAIADARSKADLMAGAAGITVGRLRSLTEGIGPINEIVGGTVTNSNSADGMNGNVNESTPITLQDIDISSDVTALYAIGYGK
jgi:uncharacterized protein YggE